MEMVVEVADQPASSVLNQMSESVCPVGPLPIPFGSIFVSVKPIVGRLI